MTGISDTNAPFFEVSGRGVVSRKRAAEALRGRIGAGAVVAKMCIRDRAQLIDVELAGRRHTANQRVAHDARLLVDLLEPKVGIAALFGHAQILSLIHI